MSVDAQYQWYYICDWMCSVMLFSHLDVMAIIIVIYINTVSKYMSDGGITFAEFK